MITLRASWLLVVILALAHGAAIAVVLLVSIPLWVKLSAAAGLTVHLFVVVRRQALLLTPDSAVAIQIGSDNVLSVQARHGEWSEYAVLGDTYVTWYLTVMNLRQAESHAVKRVAILPDSVDAEDFRKLRVWLRWNEGRGTT
jgi:toxin CptA